MSTSLDTYSNILSALQAWLVDRTDLVDDCPNFIRMAEMRIYRELRIAAMETAFSGTFATDAVTLSVPSDYIEFDFAYVSSSTPIVELSRQSPKYIYKMFPFTAEKGTPYYFARVGSNFIFGPNPNTTHTVQGVYFAKLAALSLTNQTNWFTSNAPDLILNAALVEALRYLRDDVNLVTVAEAKYNSIKAAIIKADLQERRSGSTNVGRYIPY